MLRRTGQSKVHEIQRSLSKHRSSPITERSLHRFISSAITHTSTDSSSSSRQPVIISSSQNDRRRVWRTSKESFISQKSSSPDASSGPAPLNNRRRTNKHYTTGQANTERARLLKPYDVSLRIKNLCDKERVEKAASLLQSLPLAAQNVVVWNTLLLEFMKRKKFQSAYDLYTDMKRRGFTPNTNTYRTMLIGLSKIDDWHKHPKQLAHAQSLYEYFLRYIESVKYHEPHSKDIEPSPITLYMKILGDAGQYRQVFDVFFAMDQEGPLAPDNFTFTTMFTVINNQLDNPRVEENDAESSDASGSDAKLVWRRLERARFKSPDFKLDSYTIRMAVKALSRSRLNDQNFAFEIIRDHLGLAKTGESIPPGFSENLNSAALQYALQLCYSMKKYRVCVHYMKQIIDKKPEEREETRFLVQASHIRMMLKAYVALSSMGSSDESSQALEVLEWSLRHGAVYGPSHLRPNVRTYSLVLETCMHCADWKAASRTIQLMSGIVVDESAGEDKPLSQKERSDGRVTTPNEESMTYFLRTALAIEDVKPVLQALRLAEFIGIDRLLNGDIDMSVESGDLARRSLHYRSTFAAAFLDALEYLRKVGVVDAEQLSRWQGWERSARKVRRSGREDRSSPGTLARLDDIDAAVAFDMASRNAKSQS